jgi:hypothetical protein
MPEIKAKQMRSLQLDQGPTGTPSSMDTPSTETSVGLGEATVKAVINNVGRVRDNSEENQVH